MIELNLDTLAVDVEVPPEEALNQGAPANVHLQVVSGNELPFPDPRNPNRAVRVPGLVVNYRLTKKAALEYAARIAEAAESLPDDRPKSNIVTAQSLSEVGKVVDIEQRLRKG